MKEDKRFGKITNHLYKPSKYIKFEGQTYPENMSHCFYIKVIITEI